MSLGTDIIRELQADQLQATADHLTAIRADSALPLGLAIAVTHENWPVTAGALGSFATDIFDGQYARRATDVRGYDMPTDGAEEDPKADHDVLEKIMGGLIVRFIRQGDYISAGITGANLLVNRWRNDRMDANRQMVKDASLDPRNMRAIAANKHKMEIMATAETTLMSPLSKNRKVRAVALGGLCMGTACGVFGERVFRKRIQKLIAEQPSLSEAV